MPNLFEETEEELAEEREAQERQALEEAQIRERLSQFDSPLWAYLSEYLRAREEKLKDDVFKVEIQRIPEIKVRVDEIRNLLAIPDDLAARLPVQGESEEE